MEEKLRSILKQIHWSLVVKAVVFALAWLWFPSWLFIVLALGMYLIPLFQAGKLAVPFFTLMILALLQGPSILFAVIFGAVFYAILLIKDLLLIDRRSAYELVMLTLIFLVLRTFYVHFNMGVTGVGLFLGFFVAILLALLTRGLMDSREELAPHKKSLIRLAVWLSVFIFAQAIVIGLFLPLDFVYQAVIIFLIAALVADVLPHYLMGTLTKTKVLAAGTIIFALLTVLISSARWGL